MDVINEEKLQAAADEVVDRLVKQLQAQLSPIISLVEGLPAQLANAGTKVMDDAVIGIGGEVDHLLEELNGWTAEIVVPPIVITLKAPKKG